MKCVYQYTHTLSACHVPSTTVQLVYIVMLSSFISIVSKLSKRHNSCCNFDLLLLSMSVILGGARLFLEPNESLLYSTDTSFLIELVRRHRVQEWCWP
jgi:hypothetical protein